MIAAIYYVMKKHFKLLLRSRSSALVVILGPLFLMFLVGFAFNSVGTQDVDIGIYSEEYTSLSLSYIKSLADGPFHTLKYVSKQACIDHIRQGLLATCVVFPPGMDVTDRRIDEIEFYVDYSRVNIVYQILDRVREEVSATSRAVSMDLTDDLLRALGSVQRDLNATIPLIYELQEQHDEISKEILAVSDQLRTFSVQFDKEEIDLEAASLGLGQAQHRVTTIYTDHGETVRVCDSMMNKGLREALSCAATDEEEDELRRDINETLLYANENDITEAYGRIQREFNRTRNLLLNLDKELIVLEGDLAAVDTLRLRTRSELQGTNSRVGKTVQATSGIEDHLETIYTDVDALQVRNSHNIVAPVQTNIKPIIPQTTNLLYLFPSLVTLVLMFSAILLGSSMVMSEKSSKAFFRNYVTPVTSLAYIIGMFLTTLVIVLFQMGLILLISTAYFKTNLFLDWYTLGTSLFAITSVFTLVGLFIGHLFNSEDTVILGSVTISSLFLFVSDVIMPLENMPAYVSQIAQYNPFVLSSQVLKKAMLFSHDLQALKPYLVWFLIYAVTLFVVLLVVEKLLKKRAFNKLTNQFTIRREKKKADQLVGDEDIE